MIKLVIVFLICLLATFVNSAEYLVVKKLDGRIVEIDRELYKKIYAVLERYQWPMSIASFSSMDKTELKALTTQDLPRAEESFIRQKIKTLDASLDICFIPTTLYELYAIYYISGKSAEEYSTKTFGLEPQGIVFTGMWRRLMNMTFPIDTALGKFVQKRINAYVKPSWQDILNLYKEKNENPHVVALGWEINNALMAYLKSNSVNLLEADSLNAVKSIELAKVIIAHLSHSQRELVKRARLAIYTFGTKEPLQIDFLPQQLLENIIALEYESREKNRGLLYRTAIADFNDMFALFMPGESVPATPLEMTFMMKLVGLPAFTKDLEKASSLRNVIEQLAREGKKYEYIQWDKQARPISYGNSFFAGYYYDFDACSYWLSRAKPIVYALGINKFLYAQGALRRLLFISPFNTLVSLFGKGENFHSRTISYYPEGVDDSSFFDGYVGLDMELAKALFIIKGDMLRNALQLSEFIQRNAAILRASFDPSLNAGYTDRLMDGQRKLSKLLKIMEVLRQKQIRRFKAKKNSA